jgi:hypothetical protein
MLELAYISTREAGLLLKKSPRRINQLVKQGILKGEVIGNSNVIEKASVLQLKAQRAKRSKQSNGNGHR